MKDNSDKRQLWRAQKQAYRKNRKEYTLILPLDGAKLLEDFSSEKRMNPTEFIKALLGTYQNDTHYILPNETILKDLILEIRKIGNNINQIARFININKAISIYEFRKLQDCLAELESRIDFTLTNPDKRET